MAFKAGQTVINVKDYGAKGDGVTGATTIANVHDLVTLSGASAYTVSLPASHGANEEHTFLCKDGNAATYNKTINSAAGHTINGSSTYVINTARGSVTVVSDGSNWFVKAAKV